MDVADLLAASDAFLLPSLSEPYGNAWPEAMATGLPCMGLRRQFGRVNSAAEEHITDGVTGYIVDPDDPADCARRICQLAGLPQMLESMGAEARRIALAKYRWEVTAAQYAALIMEGRAAT
jgi:glycosyltransferase involved in cell wall biosynthesis